MKVKCDAKLNLRPLVYFIIRNALNCEFFQDKGRVRLQQSRANPNPNPLGSATVTGTRATTLC